MIFIIMTVKIDRLNKAINNPYLSPKRIEKLKLLKEKAMNK